MLFRSGKGHGFVVTFFKFGNFFVCGRITLKICDKILGLEAFPDRARRSLKLYSNWHLFSHIGEITCASMHIAKRAASPALARAEGSIARRTGLSAAEGKFIGFSPVLTYEEIAIGKKG